MVFDALGELSNNKYQVKGIDFVKAILEIGLKMPLEEINLVFKTKTSTRWTGGKSSFTDQFLDYTSGRHSIFKVFYEKTFGMDPCPAVVKTFGHSVKFLISWFTSYLLVKTFGMPMYTFICLFTYALSF